jgi:NAD(P)-dependent dehydrogenase (short-subunit alcohol dehydrogenase family)
MPDQPKQALVVGSSDGIGLATVRALLQQDYCVIGVSRRAAPIEHPRYRHIGQDVTDARYRAVLGDILRDHPDLALCIYCAGIGDDLNLDNLASETRVFEVNLMAAVVTTELVLGQMLARDTGHFIGLSSIADVLVSAESPAYTASKAGISRYWEGLGLALPGRNVRLSNIRFGYVDTKMATARWRPFLMTPAAAARFILEVVEKPRLRATRPRRLAMLAWLPAVIARLLLLLPRPPSFTSKGLLGGGK